MYFQDNLADYIESSFFIYRRFFSSTTDITSCNYEYNRITTASIRIDSEVNRSQLRKKALNKVRHNQEICSYKTVYCTPEYKESLADFNYIENELVHGFVRGILHKSIELGKNLKFPGLDKATSAFYLFYTKEVIWYCNESKSSTKEQLAEDLKVLTLRYQQQLTKAA